MKDYYLIAEVAQAHDGSLGAAHSYIDIAASRGADAIKFQMHIADVESGPMETWRNSFSYQDATRQEYWKRMEFTQTQWLELKQHCDDAGVDFLCSPFSQAAVFRLVDLGVKKFKVASGEIRNYLMLDTLNKCAEEVYLSSGMSSFSEISNAIDRFDNPEDRLTLFQCTTAYPTQLVHVGINILTEFQKRYSLKSTGLSDHSGKIAPSLYAYACGARVFEVHICLHKEQFGPDTSASLDPNTFSRLSEILYQFSLLHNSEMTKDIEIHSENRTRFGKTLSASRRLKKGEFLDLSMLETKKPAGCGIDPIEYEAFVGKVLIRDIAEGDYLNEADFGD